LMSKSGAWSLSPAFDVIYAYNPDGAWTGRHQMTLNGRRDDFELDDFVACEKAAALRRGRARSIVAEVDEAVRRWPAFAAEAGVSEELAARIGATLRSFA